MFIQMGRGWENRFAKVMLHILIEFDDLYGLPNLSCGFIEGQVPRHPTTLC